tara:strand:- start:1154 stop:1483 length:330 start_codon:yes stop_codon:yes gene_type:complete
MTNEKKKTTREINIFTNDLLKVVEMFKEQGLKLEGIFLKDTESNFKTGDKKHIKELDLHGSDMFKFGTSVMVEKRDDEKYYTAWYQFKHKYGADNFENWRLVQENITYK